MSVRVRMRTTSAGPSGVVQAGQTVELPEAQAAELLAMGYADQEGIADAIPAVPARRVRRAKDPVPDDSAPDGSTADASEPAEPDKLRPTRRHRPDPLTTALIRDAGWTSS